ncbi:MAG: hypothetical protein KJ928_02050 [Candidatus Altiarchaeota archaeon]|nr:hypothetical protein [Candidatus Altiarchaeota archaeon]
MDITPPEFTPVTTSDEEYYKNGDTITVTATLDDSGYTVYGDFSNIESQSAALWTEYAGNPIFGEGVTEGVAKAYYPTVVKVSDDDYRVWYGSDSGVGYATSSDGISWTEIQNPVTGLTNANHPHVELIDGTYMMWYWPGSLYSINDIRYAESVDGQTWVNDQAITGSIISGVAGEWNGGSYGPIDVLYNPSATDAGTNPFDYSFAMYFDATTGGFEEIGLGYSSDGKNWQLYGKVLPRGNEGAWGNTDDWDSSYTTFGTVIKEADGKWHMWYSGGQIDSNDGTGYATSTDGLTWTRYANNPIMHQDDGVSWRTERTYTPVIIKDGDTYKMWFSGKDDSGNYAIGYATLATYVKATDHSNGTYTMQYTIQNGAEGSQTIPVTATDEVGNSETDESLSVTIDITEPVAAIDAPSGGDYIAGSVDVTGTAEDTTEDTNFENYTVEYCLDVICTEIYSGTNQVTSGNLATWDTTTVDDETYTLKLTVNDLAGNSNTAKIQVTVDNTAPSSSASSPESVISEAAQTEVEFTVSWSGDDVVGISNYSIQVKQDEQDWGNLLVETTNTETTYEGTIGHEYCFRSKAVDMLGNEESYPDTADTCTSVAAYKFNISLVKKWNMIASPVVPLNEDITDVLEDVNDNINSEKGVWTYDPLTEGNVDGWFTYNPDVPGTSNLQEITAGYGYWIYMDDEDTLTIEGTVIPVGGGAMPPSRNLKANSWNMIGSYGVEDKTVSNALSSLYTQDGGQMWSWPAYYYEGGSFQGIGSDTTTMEAGKGYWIHLRPGDTDEISYAGGDVVTTTTTTSTTTTTTLPSITAASFNWVYQSDGTNDLAVGTSGGHTTLSDCLDSPLSCGFLFASNTITDTAADVYLCDSSFFANSGASAAGGVHDMGAVSLSSVDTCPDKSNGVGYHKFYDSHATPVIVEHTYCVVTRDGIHYAKLQVTLTTPP